MSASTYAEFLRGLYRDPKAVSAPTPSSRALSRAIAAEVEPARPGLVIELGPGTGVVTQALLERGLSPDRLVTIECEGSFVRTMRSKFPDVIVHHGDALRFEQYIPAGAAVAAVVSGIPLLNMEPQARKSLIDRALAVGGNRRFIQLSYGWFPPVRMGSNIRLKRNTVWRNLPPAHIWTYDTVG
jgi:phosphatidylethanolamine/phosphatidyl-N-methylethanolamine N-methyltransferase